MAKSDLKIKAHSLRRQGWSIKDIGTELGVSKSCASLWCRDIFLTQKQKNNLLQKAIAAGHKGRLIGAEMNKRKKQERIAFHRTEATKFIGNLSSRDMLMAGLGIYWGEGVKAECSNLGLVNSDPRIILFMFCWFQVIFRIKKEEFRPQIFINESHRERGPKLIKYWSHLLHLPPAQFRNTVFLKMKSKKIYENHNSYYGILALRIRKGTDLKYRILSLLSAMSEAPCRGSSVG